MVEQLAAIYDRIGRADEHLETIKEQLVSYYNADGYVIRGEYKPDLDSPRGTVTLEETFIPEIDPRLNTLIGEFLHNARSSLDHLAWQLVLKAGGAKPNGNTHFPIKDTDPGTDKKGKRRSPGIPGGISAPARTLVGSAQPYLWGARYAEHPLWLLNRLWNIDKHRHVIAKGSETRIVFPMRPPRYTFASKLDSVTEHGAKLILVPDDPAVDVNAYTTVQVSIHEPEHGIERPLLRTLEEALKGVTHLLEAADATCF
jgi:hypothetical protein